MNNTFIQLGKGTINALLIVLFIILILPSVSLAVDDTSVAIEDLQSQVDARKSQMDSLNGQMDSYQEKVNFYANESASLRNDLSLIENQMKLAQLDVAMTQADIEGQEIEMQILEEKIKLEEKQLEAQKIMIEEMLFEMQLNDKLGLIEILFGSEDFNELFTEIEQLEDVSADLNNALEGTKVSKENLEKNRVEQAKRLVQLEELEGELKIKLAGFEQQENAKDALLAITKDSEAEYRVLMSELRQEQQYITSQIVKLQADIERRISESDQVGDPSLLTRPLSGGIITAVFHDPTYPFRHLFEHSGLDTAVPTGTPVYSAAPGVVAWARKGSSYGNYVMVIHSGGMATLYAHLSSYSVTADQFVSRGQVIGYSGNTGFSTGPHLHFEVRVNGIPVDPQAYVVGY
ncbi:MAG: peptidoglycan DD-metalloendopeptidase family protein [Candidatus Uhrbacteria bacterium]|nr:peptidoglycan DD-metalloendopeptidase family protein [Candidatus Uhrbacteria bacterium]